MVIHKIKQIAKQFLRKSRKRLDFLVLLWEFSLDYRRFLKFSVPEHNLSSRLSARHMEMQTIMDIHSVEKGLSLQETKHPFGAELLKRIDLELDNAPENFYWTRDLLESREALHKWNQQKIKSQQLAVAMKRSAETAAFSGTKILETRHSVRTFDSNLPVTDEHLLEAVRVASFAPSVCNRQSWNITFARSPEIKSALLALQNGNLGFTAIPVVGVISVNLSLFSGAGERNQAWIDGGIFAMSLSLALHGAGLGSCLLNTSVRNGYSEKIRKIAKIPEGHQVISMIAIGFPEQNYLKARSSRREVKDTSRFI